MSPASRKVRNVYLILMLLHTLAASFIWGINTLFLLDAGLSNTEAFAANAFFTAGMVIFEVPTGVVADTRGRRTSYLLGTVTLAVSTLCYLLMWRVTGPFWAWALASIALGLGFTFFSGAVEAWLVDALTESGYLREGGTLESILAQGEIVEGVAMLGGSIAGGVIAQATNLGVPYILRAAALVLSFICAFLLMQDTGFTPKHDKRTIDEVRSVLRCAIEHGLAHPPVRWMMLAAPFVGGVSMYAFYAMQPYLLEMYGDSRAYAVAGLAAAIVAGAQIVGGILVPHIGRFFSRRTSVILLATALGAVILALIGLVPQFLVGHGIVGAVGCAVRRADARASGVSQRSYHGRAAGHRSFVRLAYGLGRRRHTAAGARQDRGHLELLDQLRRLRGAAVPRHPVRVARATRAPTVRHVRTLTL